MKKIVYTLLLPFLMFAGYAHAQQIVPDSDLQEQTVGLKQVHDFECMESPMFSQLPAEYDVGLFCDAGGTFSKLADDYSVAEPFTRMRFWGVYDIKATETFLIEFYDGTPGQPGTNIVHTFNVTTNPVPTSFLRLGEVIHQIDVDFPSAVTLLDGWVSVSRTTLPFVRQFAWIAKSGTGNRLSYNSNEDLWTASSAAQPLFCLGGAPPVPLPIANWSVLVGLVLMAGFGWRLAISYWI